MSLPAGNWGAGGWGKDSESRLCILIHESFTPRELRLGVGRLLNQAY